VVAGAGRRGGAVLLFQIGGCDRGAGGDPPFVAVSGAGDWVDGAADSASGDAATVSHVAVSGSGAAGEFWICLHPDLPQEFSEGNPLRGGDPDSGGIYLHDPRVAAWGVAVRGRGEW